MPTYNFTFEEGAGCQPTMFGPGRWKLFFSYRFPRPHMGLPLLPLVAGWCKSTADRLRPRVCHGKRSRRLVRKRLSTWVVGIDSGRCGSLVIGNYIKHTNRPHLLVGRPESPKGTPGVWLFFRRGCSCTCWSGGTRTAKMGRDEEGT